LLSAEDYEAETIRRALAGDHRAGVEALCLCRSALEGGSMSHALRNYLVDRLLNIERAIHEAELLREAGKSTGSVRSAREAGIAEALLISRTQANRPRDPFPEWKLKYAAFGALLAKAGLRPEQVKAAMDEVRQQLEGPHAGLDRKTAGEILKDYAPMRQLEYEDLMRLAGPLGEKLPTFLPQSQRQ
jgi:hypothetical protein